MSKLRDENWHDWWALYKPVVFACALALLATIGLAVFTCWCECGPMGYAR